MILFFFTTELTSNLRTVSFISNQTVPDRPDLKMLPRWLITAIESSTLVGALLVSFLPVRGATESTFPTSCDSFDVTSVKPSAPSTPFNFSILPGSHLIWLHTNVQLMINWAYEIRDLQLLNAPKWVYSNGFDIDAKCDPPVGIDYRDMSTEQRLASTQEVRRRLQKLLADRFQLKLDQETRQMPAFELILDKNGRKFAESPKPGPDGKVKRGAIVRLGYIEMYDMSMEVVARALSQYAGRIVIDHTGLRGT